MKPPFERSYWAIPDKLIGGCYPGDLDPVQQQIKLDALTNSEVTLVINLMEQNETDHNGNSFRDYSDQLIENICRTGRRCVMKRFEIPDMSIPDPSLMVEIIKAIDAEIKSGGVVYVHCWGGKGRTGTVVGCYLLEEGLETEESVLLRLKNLTSHAARFFWPTPQTQEQENFVLSWKKPL